MFAKANEKNSVDGYKVKAVLCFSVPFQGKHFRRCQGLGYWVRWGQYVLDIRELRAFLKMPEEPKEYFFENFKKSVFETRIKEITDKNGCNDFKRLCLDMNKWIEKKHFEESKQRALTNEEEVNDLPF